MTRQRAKKGYSDTQEILLSSIRSALSASCRTIWFPHSRRRFEELAYADLLLHVVDVSDEDWEQQAETVEKVVAQLGAQDIPRVMVYNKADKCAPDTLPFYRPDEGVAISAKTGEGLDALLAAIERALGRGKHRVCLRIPYSDGAVLDMLHREAQVEAVEYAADGTVVRAVVDDKTYGRVAEYLAEE